MSTSAPSDRNYALALSALIILAFALLLMRSFGLYAIVFGDEYTYSSLSRFVSYSAAYIPGYLYFSIYKITNMCGDGFYGCARVLNTFFFVIAVPFIYLIARKICSAQVSLLICAVTLAAPISSYTIYFMPESLYFFSFWVCTWYLLQLEIKSPTANWALFGLMSGLSALVKPHAMFIIPGIVCYITYLHFRTGAQWIRNVISRTAAFTSVLLATKFSISYLLAGSNGLTFLGSFYGSQLSNSTSNAHRYIEIAEAAPKIAVGHIIALCILFGVPLAITITNAIKSITNPHRSTTPALKISFLAIILLLNLIAVVALFSASVAGTNPVETAERLHMRYYDFIFPLFYLAAASQIKFHELELNRKLSTTIAICVLAIALYAVITKLTPFTPSMIDSPELRGFAFKKRHFILLGIIGLTTIIVWIKSKSLGAKLFTFLFLPLWTIVSTLYITHEISNRLVPDVYDRAGIVAKKLLPAEALENLVVVGDDAAGGMRALFYLDNAGATRAFPIEGKPYSVQDMGQKTWLLTVGNVPLDEKGLSIKRFNGFVIASKPMPVKIMFDQPTWPSEIAGISGISSTESWGTWTNAKELSITFTTPLPKAFQLVIEANAYGPNAGRPIIISGTDEQKSFSLSPENTTKSIELSNLKNSSQVTFTIPEPTSPKSLGNSGDERTLGLGLKSITVISKD